MKGGFSFVVPGFLAIAALAVALPASADNQHQFKVRLKGFEEVPSVSTVANGTFEAKISNDEGLVEYELTYSGLQGTVTQAHIHVAQHSVNGVIVVWLCQTPGTPAPAAVAALTPMCPPSGTVTGSFTAANVIQPAPPTLPTQQILAGELADVIAAMRAGVAYANVHTSLSPGGEIRGQIGDRIFNFLHNLFR
jgi:hypothetical protein